MKLTRRSFFGFLAVVPLAKEIFADVVAEQTGLPLDEIIDVPYKELPLGLGGNLFYTCARSIPGPCSLFNVIVMAKDFRSDMVAKIQVRRSSVESPDLRYLVSARCTFRWMAPPLHELLVPAGQSIEITGGEEDFMVRSVIYRG